MEDSNVNVCRSRLFRKYKPDEKGTWHIKGEDPNCDMGGSHVEPTLKFVEGTYKDVVEHALKLPGFFNWGWGGNITKIEIEKI